MALIVPSVDNPFDPSSPIPDAYAWLSALSLDLRTGEGTVALSVHPSEAAKGARPVATMPFSLGEVIRPADPSASPPADEIRMPTLPELLAVPAFASAYETLSAQLYGLLASRVPALSGARPA